MGRKNNVINTYLEDRERFADLFNGILFKGEQIILPEELSEMDTKVRRRKDNDGQSSGKEFIRDHLKCWKKGSDLFLLGLEPEDTVQYAMPVKLLNYEALQYDKMYKEIKKAHRLKKDLSSGEYVSGFSKKDRLIPVITLGLYCGRAKWDAPASLFEMLGVDDFSERIRDRIKTFCNNFSSNLIDIKTLDERIFTTDLKEVVGFLKRQDDKEALEEYVNRNKTFTTLKEDAYNVIAALSHTRNLIIRKEEYRNKGGVDMCLAIQEMIQDGIDERMKKVNLLTIRLIEDGRIDELAKSAKNQVLQHELMEEYGI